ncbi:sensor histidine kinase [Aliidiomarina soli]|uniref:histidine kinase n=1 Tax=Aliidiomarina soli TaxID=1928574 RepID=A0A432WC38_9GAMM|nr:HAMP domain-containing sensor histidine kinase [Aliidiomarina soli]RUO29641.1 hypothetical protein CWE14_14385 [Aliidiomarina soli]
MLNSLRKSFLVTTLCVTCLSTGLALAGYTWVNYLQARSTMLERTEDYSKALAISVNQQLIHHNEDFAQSFSSLLNETRFILNAHVYLYDDEGQLNFLTSYNRPGIQPIAARQDSISALQSPHLTSNGIDIMVPVVALQSAANGDQDPRGYVFVRTSIQPLQQVLRQAGVTAVGAILFSALLSLLLASLVSHYFGRPLRRLIMATREVARTRDYSIRAPNGQFSEFDLIAHNFNTVLERIQQYIRQHDKSEAAAQQLNAELEQQVQERTNALRNANQELLETLEQLHQHQGRQVEAQKMSSLSELVAGISHEINTPLGLAVTAASMIEGSLREQPIRTDEAHEQMQLLQRNLDRAVELINNFKKLAIEHAGETATDVELSQLMEDIVTSARAYIADAKKLEVTIHSDIPELVKLKVGVWQQIISSLLENSVIHGFAGKDSGQVDIYLQNQNGHLEVRYKDNGCGVPADILRRIFDPFITSKRGHGNSGLGMHLVYNLVTHTLNGTINCVSAPDEGFEVIINCPLELVNSA